MKFLFSTALVNKTTANENENKVLLQWLFHENK